MVQLKLRCFCSSPLEVEVNNCQPYNVTDIVQLPGRIMEYLTLRLFENEYGDSIYLFFCGLTTLAFIQHQVRLKCLVKIARYYGRTIQGIIHPSFRINLPANPFLHKGSS
ncbi:uncharacterized protein CMU_009570 [Cryptosporidium muris RN66]|uniref:Microprotein domain-containing protein n=1 Tax=Cryptosporidium muris (strain RN66) TaxID=441375 RepID=B6AE24_CRYMR|nr:uncharacterized protein CMU_009570 [Cryptosporidium muris RN66]EEA06465.1 hypothetical protein, conserved [Cryptosporidium muris RN66]|eukprot:XP_002140814.1 hypothetical protein [Cryptosporidium muris RN66]